MSDQQYKGIPRWADIVVAALSLTLAAPVMAAIVLTILATSGRPILFRQKRVGRSGELFELLKFRTMIIADSGPQVTSRDDERITGIGRALRKTKLDELPTFWNVLRGDMALVGPRPEVPRYVNRDDPQWRLILSVRPGITDPTTVALRNEEDLLARAYPDIETYYRTQLQPAKLTGYIDYLQQRTFRTDLSVLGRTLAAIIRHS